MSHQTAPTMQISRLHHPVRSLGYGVRAGIWVQGCSIGCIGCVSMDTWPVRPESEMAIESVLEWLKERPGHLDGVTISGGEPTEQPAGLRLLLEGIRGIEAERGEAWDVIVYTGLATAMARRRIGWLMESADVLITGPFLAGRPSDDPLKGSANQEVLRLSARANQRYREPANESDRHFDVAVADGSIWLAGIPRRGDMELWSRKMADRGVSMDSVSWLA